MKRASIIIFSCFLLLLGCKKITSDYRDKFLGEYNFIVHITSFRYVPVSIIYDTSYTYSGKVEAGLDKNKILISSPNSNSTEFIIYEDGTLERYPYKGEFETTSRVKYFNYLYSPGSQTKQEITGEKK